MRVESYQASNLTIGLYVALSRYVAHHLHVTLVLQMPLGQNVTLARANRRDEFCLLPWNH